MSVLINELYYGDPCDCCGGFENAARQGIVFSPEALAKGLEAIYKGLNVRDEIEDHIFRETLRLFNEAASKGFTDSEWPDVPDEFINQIRTNNAIWSAFRVHRMQNDIASKLIDENGQLKKFDRWVEDIKGMTNHYVGPWLRTEYNTAVLRAHQAADWKHFEAEADIFPNVRWMPTTSPQQDPLHRQYWEKKLTLPINHPFWEKHRPGDRWNCKCTLQQTDEPVNDEVIRDFYPVPQQPGLDNNPGKDGKLFSDSHPYIAKAYKGARNAVQAKVMEKRQKTEAEKEEIRRRWNKRGYRIDGIRQLPAGDGQSKALTKAVADVEKDIRMNKSFETGVLFDTDGNILIDKRGKSYSVSFSADEVKKMKNNILTHNHPRGWQAKPDLLTHIGSSFSDADLDTAVSADLLEIRAVGPLYTYSMKRPAKGWGVTGQTVKRAYNAEERRVQTEMWQAIRAGQITPIQASAMHFHLVNKRLAKKFGWEYSKAKTR